MAIEIPPLFLLDEFPSLSPLFLFKFFQTFLWKKNNNKIIVTKSINFTMKNVVFWNPCPFAVRWYKGKLIFEGKASKIEIHIANILIHIYTYVAPSPWSCGNVLVTWKHTYTHVLGIRVPIWQIKPVYPWEVLCGQVGMVQLKNRKLE